MDAISKMSLLNKGQNIKRLIVEHIGMHDTGMNDPWDKSSMERFIQRTYYPLSEGRIFQGTHRQKTNIRGHIGQGRIYISPPFPFQANMIFQYNRY